MKIWWLSLFLTLTANLFCHADNVPLVQKNIVSTNEVYALLIAKNGDLWVGHKYGLTRYNGMRTYEFRTQTIDDGIVKVVEDTTGRFWCLSGKGILYITEGKQLRLVRKRRFNEDNGNLSLYKDKVFYNSNLGLWVYDSQTLREKVFSKPYEKPDWAGLSGGVFILSGKIFLANLNHNIIYHCDDKRGMVPMPFDSVKKYSKHQWTRVRQTRPNSGVLISIEGFPSGTWFGELKFDGRKFFIANVQKANTNHMTGIDGDVKAEQWIAVKKTITAKEKKIFEYSFADIVLDREGNFWIASYVNGLFIKYRQPPVQDLATIQPNITAMANGIGHLLAGTDEGEILVIDTASNKIVKRYLSPGLNNRDPFAKNISFLKHLRDDWFIVATNTKAYLFKERSASFKEIAPFISTIGDAQIFNNHLLIFQDGQPSHYFDLKNLNSSDPGFFPLPLRYGQKSNHAYVSSLAGAYQLHSGMLAVSSRNLLCEFDSTRYREIKFKGRPIKAATLLYATGRLYIFSKETGLLAYDGNGRINQLSASKNFNSSDITTLKLVGKQIWLLGDSRMWIYDVLKNTLVPCNIDDNVNLQDIELIGSKLFGLSLGKISIIDQRFVSAPRLFCYKENIVVNEHDTLSNDHVRLPHNKNNIAFNLGFPVYSSPEKVYYKYRLNGGNESEWR
jgi:hypothetical protein